MQKFISVCLVFWAGLLLPKNIYAQYYTNQNKIWAFGIKLGVDFNSGTPTPIFTSMNAGMGEPEGCASVCDPFGHLLFYSNGKKVYNRLGAVMPTGGSVVSFDPGSTEQAALIAPAIGHSNQYYLFSLASIGFGQLAYSIVDMSLDGGLGDVLPSSMGIPLTDILGENMIPITGNNGNIWLITHRQDTSLFLAFNITSSGIEAPVISNTGSFHGEQAYGWAMLRGSTNRRKIAQGISKSGQHYGVELYDFDPNTGIVSNCIPIDTADEEVYGVEFSPDNSKLYANGNKLFQYDISLPSVSSIQMSKFVVTDSNGGADLRLGPDGKIYVEDLATDLACISNPNLSGSACNYVAHKMIFPSPAYYATFPNLYVTADTSNKAAVDEPQKFSDIQIYPNPTATQLILITDEPIFTMTITNIFGQTCKNYKFNDRELTIDISTLMPGIYFLKINNGTVKKFVKL